MTIFESLKDGININLEDTGFDTQILLNMDGIMYTLYQLGMGTMPIQFTKDMTWEDLSSMVQRPESLPIAKQYMLLRLQMVVDPPSASQLSNLSTIIKELEWRVKEAFRGVYYDKKIKNSELPEKE